MKNGIECFFFVGLDICARMVISEELSHQPCIYVNLAKEKGDWRSLNETLK